MKAYKMILKMLIGLSILLTFVELFFPNVVALPTHDIITQNRLVFMIVGMVIVVISKPLHDEFYDFVAIPLMIIGMYLVIITLPFVVRSYVFP